MYFFNAIHFTVFSHLYVWFFFSFFFFCTTANAPSYYISCRITSSCRALASLGWWNVRWWLSSGRKIFYFLISRYLNRRLNLFFLISRDLFVFYFQRLKILSFEKSQFQVFFFQVLSFGIEAIERFQSNQPTYVSTFCYIIIVIIVGYCVITYKCSRSSRRSHRNRE